MKLYSTCLSTKYCVVAKWIHSKKRSPWASFFIPSFYFPNPLHCSPLPAEKAANMHAKAMGGHGIGSPCKPPSRVQRVRSAIRDDEPCHPSVGRHSAEE